MVYGPNLFSNCESIFGESIFGNYNILMFDASRKRLNASLGLRHKLLVSVVWYEDYRSALSSNVNGIHSVKRFMLPSGTRKAT